MGLDLGLARGNRIGGDEWRQRICDMQSAPCRELSVYSFTTQFYTSVAGNSLKRTVFNKTLTHKQYTLYHFLSVTNIFDV
jgi:hypothetical protein